MLEMTLIVLLAGKELMHISFHVNVHIVTLFVTPYCDSIFLIPPSTIPVKKATLVRGNAIGASHIYCWGDSNECSPQVPIE